MLLKTYYGVVQMATPQEYLLTEKEKKILQLTQRWSKYLKIFDVS